MKLELIKQIDPVKEETWYIVKFGDTTQFFVNEQEARRRFEVLKNIKSTEKEEIVLDSTEI